MTTQTGQKIKLKIDGIEVEARPGQVIIEVARENGIYIPYLCWHPILKPYGACRMCIVQTNKTPGLPASCHTTVMDGMEVKTSSEEIEAVRRDILGLTLVNHPHGCLTCWRIEHCGPRDVCLRNVSVTDRCVVCPQNERCELQDVTYYVKLNEVPLPYVYRHLPLETRGPFIDHDMNLCIVCGKCVRACHEIEGADAITFEQRGNRTIVRTALGGTLADSGCTFCGVCVDVCPVGAITEKDSKWGGRADAFIPSACAHCSVGCSLDLNIKKNKLVRITHDIEGPANHGHECVQGKFGYKWVYSKDRLMQPMVRREGKLQPATWDEALDTLASALARYQPDQIALFGSPKVTNEDNFVLQKFGRAVLGVSSINFFDPLCPPAALAGLEAAFGSAAGTGTMWELRDSRLIFVVDSDLTYEQPVAGLQVKEAARRGAHVIVLDPRVTELAMHATERLVCRPGTEVAVLGAIARAILDQKLEDKEFIKSRCIQLEDLEASLAPFTLDAAEKLSGVPQAQMLQVARLLAAQKPGAFLFSPSLHGPSGDSGQALGAAIADVAMLTGNVGRRAAGVFPLLGESNSQGAADMGCLPDKLPGGIPATSTSAWLRLNEAWGGRVPKKAGLSLGETLDAIRSGKIKAAIILGENQLLPDPGGSLAEALSKIEFLAVHEVFLRDLEPSARVVFPAATFAEREGTYTSFERRVQKVGGGAKPVADVRSAWQVIAGVAKRMGAGGFDYRGPADVFAEIARLVPAYAGLDYERLALDGVQWPCPEPGHSGTPALHAERFAHGLGKFQPLSWPSPAVGGRSLVALTRVFREIKGTVELNEQHAVELNAADARRVGVANGDKVSLISGMGTLTASAHVNGRAPEGYAIVTLAHAALVKDVFNKPTPGPLAPFTRAKRYPVRVEKATS